MTNKKYEISSDKDLNPVLKEEVSSLRGGILEQAEKTGLPKRFIAKDIKDRPGVLIIDQITGRESEVSLFAYGSVRQTLRDLFKEEE